MVPVEKPAAVRLRGLRCLAAAVIAAATALVRGLVGPGSGEAVAELALIVAFVAVVAVDWWRLRGRSVDTLTPTQRACLAGAVGSVLVYAAVILIGGLGLHGLVGFWVPAAVLVAAPAAATGWWALRQVVPRPAATDV